LIIVVELLNTGIEKLANLVHAAPHPGIGHVKDLGSAAVAVALILAALVWLAAIAESLGLW
jgi:diacylglycerol kinase (ATP)